MYSEDAILMATDETLYDLEQNRKLGGWSSKLV